ncbi:hypothetical protein SAMN05216582_12912 [Selenomonas ruminantium]|uniref:Uncharacterized protein n=1 Tax=Selenomonas ruminantium TaxID=971 RepID=A0A1M6WXZ9_SELRU|nr:hypothetical protein [Selenomonas ruminantium]SHK98652.1 hypothetical protein SAMN05216582_12912 [Selenomonas ruminantium]
MSNYANFQVGERFPLPIKNQQDGGLFQIDANGCMFILQLSRHDIIAAEAFRTGKMELALYEQDGLLFFLYQIDGIFKEGWGDAPFSLAGIKPELLPTKKSLADHTLHLYLVDTTLQILLAQRDVAIPADFMAILGKHVAAQKTAPMDSTAFALAVQTIWAQKSPAQMREAASAVIEVPLDIPLPPSKQKLN